MQNANLLMGTIQFLSQELELSIKGASTKDKMCTEEGQRGE
jgi:hypothetical protein